MKSNWIERTANAIKDLHEWATYFHENVAKVPPCVSVHLGIFVEPYLGYVFDGTKTVESRFSVKRCDPFGVVNTGDVLLIKEAAGPIKGICKIGNVWSYRVEPETLVELQTRFQEAMCAEDPTFWNDRLDAGYATLMQIGNVSRIQPFEIDKRDRRGWVVVKRRTRQLQLWDE